MDFLCHRYNIFIDEYLRLTPKQVFLLTSSAQKALYEEFIKDAKLHGREVKTKPFKIQDQSLEKTRDNLNEEQRERLKAHFNHLMYQRYKVNG